MNPNLSTTSAWLKDVLSSVSTRQRAHWLINYAELRTSNKKRDLNTETIRADDGAKFAALVNASLRHAVCSAEVLRALSHAYHKGIDCSTTDELSSAISANSRLLPRIELPRWLFNNICICGEGADSSNPNQNSKGRCTATGATRPHNVAPATTPNRGKMRTVAEVLDVLSTLESIRFYTPLSPPGHPVSTPNLSPSAPRELFTVNVNAHGGAALTLSSAHGAHRLVRDLLERGADPKSKGGMAVRAAIRRKDVDLVRMLVERSPEKTDSPSRISRIGHLDANAQNVGDRNERGHAPYSPPKDRERPAPSTKRRRLLDRVEITPDLVGEAMRLDARDIVNYFVLEKGCSPDIRTLGRTFFK